MPITDPALPPLLLDALRSAGVRFVVLHREDEIGTPLLDGDLDIAVGTSPGDAMRRVDEPLRAGGVRPTIRWTYDVGGTQAYFLATESGRDGMQADLMYDPGGLGRYGLRSLEILGRASEGKHYPTPAPLDAALYQLSKRWNKGQDHRMADSIAAVGAFQSRIVATRIDELFEGRTAASLYRLLQGQDVRAPNRRFSVAHAKRYTSRIVEPAGFWVDIVVDSADDSELVDGLFARFSRWLPLCARMSRPTARFRELRWWAVEAVPNRLRPRVLFSFANTASRMSPDLEILRGKSTHVDAQAKVIVAAMADRLAL